VDSSCGPVTNNVVSGNTVNEACAGILVGTAAGSNSIGSNTFFNARNTVSPPAISAAVEDLAWLQNFRRLIVRYERYADTFLECFISAAG
jgi:hypothetical protein